ncbi:class I SAM-dependent methyltransferase [Faecalibacter sp. LW9]|uniref:class I SAM-dependent methyltransferase n=1 Tax=Faecalibacter sp. LW9 TaxID=3103144 RepID=UPI002AFED811|nr:class I SAM-dependent methyltransferase [Faecalibacter sp. LW9]
MDKKFLRALIFRHLDGIVTAPVLATLAHKGVLHYIVENKKVTLSQLSNQFQTNEGYLNVALRVLASQNMLSYELDSVNDVVTIEVNKYSERAFTNYDIYEDLYQFLKLDEVINRKDFSDEFCRHWIQLFDKYENYLLTSNDSEFVEKPLHFQICKHIEGVLIGPLIVRLGMSGLFHKYFMEASFSADEFHKNPQHFEKILDRLVKLDWFTKQGKNYQFTETGLFFARRASAYGVTVSYLPMFSKLDDLIYGSPSKIREIKDGEDEIHVDREMNVWGSGGAHATYFKVIDEFIMEIFNRPLDEQPKGILDMGCGNGALLQHLYEVVERYTLRGRHLDDYPLFLVGADYNQAALKVTRANLIKNDIWAKVIWGDIGDPERLSNDLKQDYNISLSELLNIRTFLDHNRIWSDTSGTDKEATSTGAYAYRGKRLRNADVEESLKIHLQKWAPYVKRYGLLLIELHTIAPQITSKNLGNTAATAYDATHGFSDQYILEVDVFHRICQEAGLSPDEKLFKKFPNNELATVSINYLKA